jgi:hypothetical protein
VLFLVSGIPWITVRACTQARTVENTNSSFSDLVSVVKAHPAYGGESGMGTPSHDGLRENCSFPACRRGPAARRTKFEIQAKPEVLLVLGLAPHTVHRIAHWRDTCPFSMRAWQFSGAIHSV